MIYNRVDTLISRAAGSIYKTEPFAFKKNTLSLPLRPLALLCPGCLRQICIIEGDYMTPLLRFARILFGGRLAMDSREVKPKIVFGFRMLKPVSLVRS